MKWLLGVSKIHSCRIVKEVTAAILNGLADNIRWPNDEQSCRKISAEFYRIAGVPMVVGAVDGTLVNLVV